MMDRRTRVGINGNATAVARLLLAADSRRRQTRIQTARAERRRIGNPISVPRPSSGSKDCMAQLCSLRRLPLAILRDGKNIGRFWHIGVTIPLRPRSASIRWQSRYHPNKMDGKLGRLIQSS
jgi:hypothetical protein